MILSYKLVKRSESSFNYARHVINQYLKFAAPVLGSILITFLLPLVGSGPIWSEATDLYAKPCYDNWFYNLLMMNNFQFKDSVNIFDDQSSFECFIFLV